MKRFSLIDSGFPSTGTVKGLLNCITNTHERAMRRASLVFGRGNKGRVTPVSHTSSSPSSSTCTLSGFETTPQEPDVDTPSSWYCRGMTEKADYPLRSEATLMDSQVFVFWPEDFDFACAGEGCYGRPIRRASIQAARTRCLRRWSSPQCFGFAAHKQPSRSAATTTAAAPAHALDAPCFTSASSISITPRKKKPTPLRTDISLKMSTKAHGVNTYCASNKWGNQPPAGYI